MNTPLAALRSAIIEALYPTSANSLPSVCEALGMASGNQDEAFSSKRNYIDKRIRRLSTESLLNISHKLIKEQDNYELSEAVFTIEDTRKKHISDITRRAIGRSIAHHSLSGRVPLLEFLNELWPISRMPSNFYSKGTVQDDLERHMGRNDDMSNDDALGAVGAYSCSQRRFFLFLEALTHPRTRDEKDQRQIVETVNIHLQRDGFMLAQTGSISGYPLFSVKEIGFPDESPSDDLISEALASFDEAGVHTAWTHALERRNTHPEGAITSARSLLETVCKHIIEDCGGEYSDKDELPKLYHTAADHLKLAPDQYTEDVFRTILGNCQSIVNNLGSVRNRLGDAHGRGRKAARPLPRHAELAVNLAGTVAMFLVATWKARCKNIP